MNGTSTMGVVLGVVMLAVSLSFGLSVAPVLFAEMFPARVRYSGSAIAYNIPQMIIGGTAPLFATYLVVSTSDRLAPAFYVTIVSFVAFVLAYALLPETSNLLEIESAEN